MVQYNFKDFDIDDSLSDIVTDTTTIISDANSESVTKFKFVMLLILSIMMVYMLV